MVKKLDFGLKNLVIKKIPRRLLFIVGYCSSARTRLGHGVEKTGRWPGSVREVAEKVGRCRVLFIGSRIGSYTAREWLGTGLLLRLGIGLLGQSGSRPGSWPGMAEKCRVVAENVGRCREVARASWIATRFVRGGVRELLMVSG